MLVALAAAVRLWGLDFGLPNTKCRPDENLPALLALGFLRGDPNPHFFNWPSLYMKRIVVQESPLILYSETPAFVSGDQQDVFFLPLAGFHRIRRAGPNLYLYRRRIFLRV